MWISFNFASYNKQVQESVDGKQIDVQPVTISFWKGEVDCGRTSQLVT